MVSAHTTEYTVDRLSRLGSEDASRLADIQKQSLSLLRGISAIDHVLKEHEVDAFANDERILKFVIRHEGALVGVFAISHVPSEGWDNLSDRFFEGYYPHAFENRRFVYLAGSFVAPEHMGQGAYSVVIDAVMDYVDEAKIEAFAGDMAAVNYQWMKPMLQKAMNRKWGYCNWEDIDTHHFSTATFDHHDKTVDIRGEEPVVD